MNEANSISIVSTLLTTATTGTKKEMTVSSGKVVIDGIELPISSKKFSDKDGIFKSFLDSIKEKGDISSNAISNESTLKWKSGTNYHNAQIESINNLKIKTVGSTATMYQGDILPNPMIDGAVSDVAIIIREFSKGGFSVSILAKLAVSPTTSLQKVNISDVVFRFQGA